MGKFIPLSKDHLGKYWIRPKNFLNFAGDILCPVGYSELAKLATTFPLIFTRREEKFVPAVLMGFIPGQNLFIDPQGNWLGRFIPSALLGFPFLLGQDSEGNYLLLIDEEYLTDSPCEDCVPLFDSEENFSPQTQEILNLLINRARDFALTFKITEKLQELDLFKPLDINLEINQKVHQIKGFYIIDYAKFQALSPENFLELRTAQALELIYSHLISLSNFDLLRNLLQLRSTSKDAMPHQQAVEPPSPQEQTQEKAEESPLEKVLSQIKFPGQP